jgi:hypothetical protein
MTVDESKITNGRLIEGAYVQDETLTSVVIPEGVTDIGELAFYGCVNLREVVFPKSLKTIREEAFGETALVEVLLPAGLEEIEEKAFFSCDNLRHIEVPGANTIIGSDAFGCCDSLVEGYVGCGYPENIRHHERLQYTLLWCSCPDKHSDETSKIAEDFIAQYEELVMEWIIKNNNVPAMNGIAGRTLLHGDIDKYIIQSNEAGTSEITALLMSMHKIPDEGDFEL